MSQPESQPDKKSWHVASWPPLAWLETALKLVALAIGIAALFRSLSGGEFALPTGAPLIQTIVLGLLSLGLVTAIFDRLAEREIVAMVFVILNNLGHWGMVLTLVSSAGPDSSLVPFAALMLAGDLVKLLFLRRHNFQVRDTPRGVLYGLTLFYVVGYLLLLVLELL